MKQRLKIKNYYKEGNFYYQYPLWNRKDWDKMINYMTEKYRLYCRFHYFKFFNFVFLFYKWSTDDKPPKYSNEYFNLYQKIFYLI